MSLQASILFPIINALILLHTASAEIVQIYGCRFVNKNFYIYDKQKVLDPQWGENMQSVNFQDSKTFTSFLTEVDNIYDEFLTSVRYNTVDPYIEMYNAYQQYRKICNYTKDFEKFFDQYQYDIRNRQTAVSMSLEMLERVKNKLENTFPGVSRAGCIASTTTAFSRDMVENFKYSNAEEDLRKRNHVVAVYRVNVNARTGYLILNPGDGVERSIVVMEDDFLHLSRFSSTSCYKKHECSMLYDKKHIKCVSFNPHRFMTEISHYYINIEKCYCSYMDTADKANLLDNEKIIQRRKADKSYIGISAHVREPKNILYCLPFDMSSDGYREIGLSHRMKYKKHLSGNYSENMKSDDDAMKEFCRVGNLLGYEDAEFYNKMKRLGEIIDDRPFANEVTTLDYKFNIYRASRMKRSIKHYLKLSNNKDYLFFHLGHYHPF